MNGAQHKMEEGFGTYPTGAALDAEHEQQAGHRPSLTEGLGGLPPPPLHPSSANSSSCHKYQKLHLGQHGD